MDVWMDGRWTDAWMDGWTDGSVCVCVCVFAYVCKYCNADFGVQLFIACTSPTRASMLEAGRPPIGCHFSSRPTRNSVLGVVTRKQESSVQKL